MSRIPWFAAWLSAVPIAAMAEHPPIDLEEGLWEFRIHYDVMGTPQRFEPYATTRCITRDDALPRIERSGQECQLIPHGQMGRTLTWALNCSSNWEMVQGQGRMHYLRDRGNGNVYVQILGSSSPPYSMAFHIRGERIGECEPPS